MEEFLAAVPEDARVTLEKLRAQIRSVVPEAAESISYGIPMFKLGGRPLVGYGATKNHCALYCMSPEIMRAHAAELKAYDTSKGTIRFPAGKPLPATLVKKLVKARIREIERPGSGYAGKSQPIARSRPPTSRAFTR